MFSPSSRTRSPPTRVLLLQSINHKKEQLSHYRKLPALKPQQQLCVRGNADPSAADKNHRVEANVGSQTHDVSRDSQREADRHRDTDPTQRPAASAVVSPSSSTELPVNHPVLMNSK